MDKQMIEDTSGSVSGIKNIGLILVGICAITLGAKIQIPFWPVPMTLQTLAIFLVASGLGLRLGLATIIGYLVVGFAGLPVFAGYAAGPAYFAGPTAGFLFGFIALVSLVGYADQRRLMKGPVSRFAVFIVADIACFLFGLAWLAYGYPLSSGGNGIGAAAAFSAAVMPFILGDVLKAGIAAMSIAGNHKIREYLANIKNG